jgi:hypothetical protein
MAFMFSRSQAGFGVFSWPRMSLTLAHHMCLLRRVGVDVKLMMDIRTVWFGSTSATRVIFEGSVKSRFVRPHPGLARTGPDGPRRRRTSPG